MPKLKTLQAKKRYQGVLLILLELPCYQSGTVVKSAPSEKAAETVIDQSSGCDLASSDGMYITAKKYGF